MNYFLPGGAGDGSSGILKPSMALTYVELTSYRSSLLTRNNQFSRKTFKQIAHDQYQLKIYIERNQIGILSLKKNEWIKLAIVSFHQDVIVLVWCNI